MTFDHHSRAGTWRWRLAPVIGLFGLWSVSLVGCYQSSGLSAPQVGADSLIRLLRDPDTVIRRTAAESLGKIGYQQAAPSLILALDDAGFEVREAAVRSLSQVGPLDNKTGERVARLLVDPAPTVRRAAAQTLLSLDLMRELWPLVVTLTTEADSDVRGTIIQALEGLEAHEVRKVLADGLRDPDARVRQAAVVSLAETGDSQVSALLRERLTKDTSSEVRAEAAYRLQFFPLTDAEDVKFAALQDEHRQVRRWAQQTLKGLAAGHDSGLALPPAPPAVPVPSHQYP